MDKIEHFFNFLVHINSDGLYEKDIDKLLSLLDVYELLIEHLRKNIKEDMKLYEKYSIYDLLRLSEGLIEGDRAFSIYSDILRSPRLLEDYHDILLNKNMYDSNKEDYVGYIFKKVEQGLEILFGDVEYHIVGLRDKGHSQVFSFGKNEIKIHLRSSDNIMYMSIKANRSFDFEIVQDGRSLYRTNDLQTNEFKIEKGNYTITNGKERIYIKII